MYGKVFSVFSIFGKNMEETRIFLECEVYEYGNYHPQYDGNEYRAASGS